MKKRVAIIQSNYIPWKGYFDIINMVDEFILFDDVQFTRRDWRNRNMIKTPKGLAWLTIPVDGKGNFLQKIKDTQVSQADWMQKHWKTLQHNYSSAPYFKQYRARFEELYLETKEAYLSKINYRFLVAICNLLGIKTHITWSMNYSAVGEKTERLISLCQQAGATEYLSGPAAKNYIQDELFSAAEIELCYMNYAGYPEYPQLYPPFNHAVSILDLIFNAGPTAQRYMLSFK